MSAQDRESSVSDRNGSAPLPVQTGEWASENPQFLERLVALSPDPMYVVDIVEHRFLYVNDATVQLLGIARERLMEPNAAFLLLERIHADDIPEVVKRYEKLGTEEEVPNEKFPEEGVSYRFLNTDGKWRWFESRETVFARSAEGGVTHLIGIARDIDDRKRAEEELYNSREKLRQFIEHTPAPIAVLNKDLRYVAVSRRWMTDYRLRYDDITGMHHFDVFKKVPADWKEVLYRCLKGAVERNEGAKLIRRNGEVQWIRWEVRPWYAADKTIGGVIIFSEDITNRILAEEETRRNEEDLRYAQRLARVGSWSWDGSSLKTGYRYSEETLRIYGVSSDEKIPFFNKQKGKFYREDEWEKLREAVETTLKTGKLTEVEVEAIRSDGVPLWINARVESVSTLNNNVVGLRGTVHDITERKRLEAEHHQNELRLMESRKTEEFLLSSQRRLQGIFDSVFGFIGLFTLDGVFVEINQTTLSFGNLNREDVVGKHLYDVIWFGKMSETREKMKKAFSRAAEGKTLRFEFPIFLNEGKYITVDATFGPLRDEEGKVVNIIGFGVDITERLNAQRELRENQTWLELALQTAKLGSWRYDLKTGIFTGDITSRTMHGVADRETFDSFESTTKNVHPDDIPLIQEKFERLLREGGAKSAEYRVVAPDGTIKWVLSTGRVDEETECLIAAVQDITDQKLGNEQMATLRDELAHAARLGTLGEMASGLAHELNQPLAALQIYAHTALTIAAKSNAEGLVSLLQKMSVQSHRAGEIIRRMRGFVSRSVHRPTSADAVRLVQDVLVLMETYLRHQAVAIDFTTAPDLPQIQVDVVQIQQVLLNLIRNGVEAMSELPSKVLTIRIDRVEYGLRFNVSDIGGGIDPEISRNLFQPFHTTKENGMGLGLAISRTLVEAHGGEISARQNESGETTFSFTLPGEATDYYR